MTEIVIFTSQMFLQATVLWLFYSMHFISPILSGEDINFRIGNEVVY